GGRGRVLAAEVRAQVRTGFLPAMMLIVAGVGRIRAVRSPARSISLRKSASVRSRPPVTTSMFRSVWASIASNGDDPGRSGRIGSTTSSLVSAPIAARMLAGHVRAYHGGFRRVQPVAGDDR